MEDPLTKRRRFLQGVGVSGSVLVAGCSGVLDSDDVDDDVDDEPEPDDEDDVGAESDDDTGDGETDGDDGVEHGDGDSREVGIVAEPDQEAMAELQQEVQTGEIDQEEALERQEEIIGEAINELTEVLQAETDIEINDEYPEVGAIRTTGDPYQLVDALSLEPVSVLIAADDLEVEQQQPTG